MINAWQQYFFVHFLRFFPVLKSDSPALIQTQSVCKVTICRLCRGSVFSAFLLVLLRAHAIVIKIEKNETGAYKSNFPWMWMWSNRVCWYDLAERLQLLAASAKLATVLGSIPASSDTVTKSEGRQMKQCWNKVHKNPGRSKKLVLLFFVFLFGIIFFSSHSFFCFAFVGTSPR